MCYVFFFNDTATTEIYTLSLHDALPISHIFFGILAVAVQVAVFRLSRDDSIHLRICFIGGIFLNIFHLVHLDRKSTPLNSSHANISYAVFCLKKKKNTLML